MSESVDDAAQEILFETRSAGGDKLIGFACLNRVKALNALNLNMCARLLDQFRQWKADERIVAVVLHAAGDKGFSAGGDVATVVRHVRGGKPDRYVYGDSFFDVEYTLDRMIHTYPKPLVTYAHGICMGGGVGLTVGGSHRIVSANCRIAMPEIHIGLFPDVGGGYFLNRVPGGIGRVMALTGLMINESDAIFAGLADYFVPLEARDDMFDAMTQLPWSGNADTDREHLTGFLLGQHHKNKTGLATPNLMQYFDSWRFIAGQPTTTALLDALQAAANEDDYFASAAKALAGGSPTTALITEQYLRRTKSQSLVQVLNLDLVMARQFQRHHDFSEGVRALLIDKDRNPQWEAASFGAVDPQVVARHFEAL
jgi:enoyl-CoA hydratase/carnithine racemase